MSQVIETKFDIIYPETTILYLDSFRDFTDMIIPPTIKEIHLTNYNRIILPKSIVKLFAIKLYLNENISKLDNLEHLEATYIDGNLNLLPKNLKTLICNNDKFGEDVFFPDSLEALLLKYVDSPINLPPNLKLLKIECAGIVSPYNKYIHSSLNFPYTLEVLDITLDNYQLLEYLPEGLKYLKLKLINKKDNNNYSKLILPKSLIELEFDEYSDNESKIIFELPSNLKCLTPSSNLGFEVDKLPMNLESLTLKHSFIDNKKLIDKIFQLKNLKELNISLYLCNFNLCLPLSLTKLKISSSVYFTNMEFPKLQKLETNYPVNKLLLSEELEELIINGTGDMVRKDELINLDFTMELRKLKTIKIKSHHEEINLPFGFNLVNNDNKIEGMYYYKLRIYQKTC